MMVSRAAAILGPGDVSPHLAFLVEYLDLPAATDDPDARWEVFQLRYLNNQGLLGVDAKSRQAGWSWTAAAWAVADGILHKRSTNIFVSINLEEAQEKVRYANQITDALVVFSGISIGRQTHHLPLIAEWSKSQVLCEGRIETT